MMRERLLRIAKWLAFPAFYLFCLGVFGYLKFPYDRLKDRIVLEIDKRGKPGQHLEIGSLTSYWFTGVEVTNIKLHLPPDEPTPGVPDFGAATPPRESVITIDEAHVRVKILPLLIGRVRLDFWASAFGGEIKGTVPVGDGKGDVEIALEHVEVGKIDPVAQAVGVPIKGNLSGKVALTAGEGGKFGKANGNVDLTIEGASVSDGKTKIAGLIELPQAKLGTITFSAEAKDGTLKVTKFAANGPDLELAGDGKVTLKEQFGDAVADLFLRFKFTDAYRGKNATTKSLLGEPGSTTPGLIEIQVPKMKKAKRPDGFFGWHVYGPLKKLKFDPTTADFNAAAASPAAPGKRGKGADSPFGVTKKPMATPPLPLGPSTAKAPDPAAVPPPTDRESPEIIKPPPTDFSRRGQPSMEPVPPAAVAPPVPIQPPPQPPPQQPQPAAPEPVPAPAPEQPAVPDQPAPDQPVPPQ